MKTRILVTTGQGHFEEQEWDKPEITDNEIEVRSIMTGVCRSDIDMMTGGFGPLPIHMQGHEGLGQVTKIGANVTDINVGDYVATRGEPAYADFYNAKPNEYVRVPEASPRYIIEPVACALNLIFQPIDELSKRAGNDKRMLILGSGFLANVVYQTLIRSGAPDNITIVGNSNKELWGSKLSQSYEGTFDVVFDLSTRTDVFDKPILNNEALVIFGAQKMVTTDFSNLLWKACTMVFPSPRTDKFHQCMVGAVEMIENGIINVDSVWTKAYNRETEWRQAFSDGLNRPINYSRGYIYW
jgi:NADPH:quinone reductase-like Zn-dependent oxidoreductase